MPVSLPPVPWDNQIFSFGWNPYTTNLVQCNQVDFGWQDNFNAAPNSTGPYQLLVYSGSGQPLAVNVGFGNSLSWQLTVPAGNLYMFAMKDSRGFSGGASQVVQVFRSSTSCNESSFPSNSLEYSLVSTTSPQCGKMQFLVKNGQPPYTLDIIPENHFPKTLNFSSPLLEYVIDLSSNSRFFAVLSDSSGKVSMQGLTTVTPSNDASCIEAASTVTSGFSTPTTYSLPLSATADASGSSIHRSNIGALVGGIVAGLALLFLVIGTLYLFRKHRKKPHSVRALDGEMLTSPVERPLSFTHAGHPTPWVGSSSQEEGTLSGSARLNVPLLREPRPKDLRSGLTAGERPMSTSSVETISRPSSARLSLHNVDDNSSNFPGSSNSYRSLRPKVPRTSNNATLSPHVAIQQSTILTEADVGVAIPPPPKYSET